MQQSIANYNNIELRLLPTLQHTRYTVHGTRYTVHGTRYTVQYAYAFPPKRNLLRKPMLVVHAYSSTSDMDIYNRWTMNFYGVLSHLTNLEIQEY